METNNDRERCSCGNLFTSHNVEEGDCCHLGNLAIYRETRHTTADERSVFRAQLGLVADHKRAQIIERDRARKAKFAENGDCR